MTITCQRKILRTISTAATKKGSSRICGEGLRRLVRGLAFGLAGSAAPSLSTLGRLAGRPWCPPSLLRHVLRVPYRKGRCAAVYLYGLRPLHLCGTRLEGGHQGLSRRYGGVEGEPVAWPFPEHQRETVAIARTRLPITSLAPVSACLPECLPTMPRALARPTRTSRSGRVFGAHPRGEFRTSGAAVGHISTRPRSGLSGTERGGRV